MKTRIHVNRQKIVQNRRDGTHQPVITAKTYKDNRYGHEAVIDGPSRVIYRPQNPLPCGAVLWIETDASVQVLTDA